MPDQKPFFIDSIDTYTKINGFNTPDNKPLERLYARFRSFINFIQFNGLTTRTILAENEPITDELTIMSSDLTDEGLALLRKCYHKWLNKLDHGMKPDDMRLFEKELTKMRSS